MSQPIIGVTMSMDDYGKIRPGTDYSFVRSGYGEEIKRSGGQPIFLNSSIDPAVAARICDGIVISGGEDLNPVMYQHSLASTDRRLEPLARTLWESELIDACDQANVSILGVCYGSQLLNVHYGGTLYQDLATERQGSLDHGISSAAETHSVTFDQAFLGFERGETVPTAHRHHQAVNQLAPDFTVAAYAPDGTIEAISGRGHYGVQWHPESDGTANQIYRTFIARCRPRAWHRTLRNLAPRKVSRSL